jgi:Co/Zn/Cd efflux system component
MMIALLIGYESLARILNPVPIHFAEAIPIACLGLAVNFRKCMAAERRRPSGRTS